MAGAADWGSSRVRSFPAWFRPGQEPDAELRELQAELQLRTRAESAWADASHDLTYKTTLERPLTLQRSVNRLLALVELFDGEMGRAQDDLLALPGFPVARMLLILERLFLPLARRDYDAELSTLVLRAVSDAYGTGELDDFQSLMERFVTRSGEQLRTLYARWVNDPFAHPLLLQPESLAVFERVESNLPAIRDAWTGRLPSDLLDELAGLWSIVISRPGDRD